ncbi:MAG: hypothetical protein KAV82_14670 [Phycisphaerae bacterium]|nr:hypothetical protein [Phycisphaerae bacterium]
MRLGHSEIRKRFGDRFLDLGVDCFTLYVQDDWQPACYIPHEIDPHLFYPETMYTGPLCDYFQNTLKRLRPVKPGLQLYSHKERRPVSLRCLLLQDAPNTWLNPNDPLEAVFEIPSFRSFVGREEIGTVAIFAPDKPIYERATHPELLFLNTRRKDWRASKGDLAKNMKELPGLVKKILEFSHEQFHKRSAMPAWEDWLHRSVRCQSQLITIMHNHLLYGAAPPAQTVYQRLLEVLLESFAQSDSDWLATLHLFESSEKDLRLREKARWPRSSASTHDRVCDGTTPDELSITLCTSLVGRAHLLSQVDPPDRPSVFLTPEESKLLTEKADKGSLGPLTLESQGKAGHGSWPPGRLVLNTRNPDWSIVRKKLPGTLTRVYRKLQKRSQWHYGDIFVPMTKSWQYGGSELCLPIVVGRQVLGCVNIESARPFSMNYGYVNMLTALSAIAGMAITRMHNRALLDNVQRTADLIHSRQMRWDVGKHLNDFARTVRDHVLCDSVDFIRPNPYRMHSSRRIASSDSKVLTDHPNGTDWSEYVANTSDCSADGAKFAGVVLTVDTENPGRIANATRVFARDDSTLDPDTQNVRFEPIKQDLPSDRISDRWPTKCRLLIGLRLEPDNEREAMPQRASGVVWFAYFHPARVYGPPTPATGYFEDGANFWRLGHCIALLRTTASHCSPVPLSWSSRQIRSRTLSTDLAHSAAHHSLDVLAGHVTDHFERGIALDGHKLRAAARTAIEHRGLYMDLERIESIEDLIAEVANARAAAEEYVYTFDLAILLQEAWDCACLETNRWPTLALADASLPKQRLQTHKTYLFLVVFNIFTNSIKYGGAIERNNEGPLVPRLTVSLVDEDEYWALRFRDPGEVGDRENTCWHESLDLGQVIKEGIGAIYWLSCALGNGKDPRLESDNNGTCWTIFIRKGKT